MVALCMILIASFAIPSDAFPYLNMKVKEALGTLGDSYAWVEVEEGEHPCLRCALSDACDECSDILNDIEFLLCERQLKEHKTGFFIHKKDLEDDSI